MKAQKLIIAIFLSLGIVFGSSCVIIKPKTKHDMGLHKGWFKNKNNPHNPNYKGKTNQKKENKNKGPKIKENKNKGNKKKGNKKK